MAGILVRNDAARKKLQALVGDIGLIMCAQIHSLGNVLNFHLISRSLNESKVRNRLSSNSFSYAATRVLSSMTCVHQSQCRIDNKTINE